MKENNDKFFLFNIEKIKWKKVIKYFPEQLII